MIGQNLAHYQIIEMVGKGGMGEVYRASDTQLDRDVAIKILPESLALNPTRLARFEKEAKTLASLNHVGIATVFSLHEEEGIRFMAMELVPGSDLSVVLADKSLDSRRAMGIALQVATALEVAHGHGIIHRDLKPQNIMITPAGEARILDFGLARSLPTQIDDDEALTMTAGLTRTGDVVGTPAYMSPEQMAGDEVDTRTDIWAFGAVLFEMLTGQRVFAGKSYPETAYLVSNSDPDLTTLPEGLPLEVMHLVRRSLAKEPVNRLQSIGDARVVLQEALGENGSTVGTPPLATTRSRGIWALLLLIPLVALAAWYFKPTAAPPDSRESRRFEITAPDSLRFVTGYKHGLALSPDGQTLAFVAGTIDHYYSVNDAETALYLRNLDQWESRRIPGTEGAYQPVFSPDGQWLAFEQDHKLKKVRVSGGDVQNLEAGHPHMGISWGEDGSIIFAHFGGGGLGVISANGGEPDTLTVPDPDSPEKYHRLPHHIPGRQAVLFTSMDMANSMDYEINSRIKVLDLQTGEIKTLIQWGTDARYVGNNTIIFAREGNLRGVPFDPDKLEIIGDEYSVLENVSHAIHAGFWTRESAAAQFTVSDNGTLAYMEGSVFPERIRQVVWIDRQGNESPLDLDPRQYSGVFLSHDGSKALLSTSYRPNNVYTYEFKRGLLRRQTFTGTNYLAVWGPGPGSFTFSSNRDGTTKAYMKELDTRAESAVVLEGTENHWVSLWNREGTVLLTDPWESGIWSFTPDGDGEMVLPASSGEKDGALSPDGAWLAYTVRESDVRHVYVQPFRRPGPSLQVTVEGGSAPGWSHDGKELYFWNSDSMMAVDFKVADGRCEVGPPRALFQTNPSYLGSRRNYGIAPDGRFLVVKSTSDSLLTAIRDEVFPGRIRVITEWLDDLK